MAFGFKRIIDLSALSIKQLNDQMEQIWIKMMGGISGKDLSPSLKKVIDSKVSDEEVSSKIEQSSKEIKLMVSKNKVGNLIINGNGNFGMSGWTGSGFQDKKQKEEGFIVSGSIMQCAIKIEPKKRYRLGFDYLGIGKVDVFGQFAGNPIDSTKFELCNLELEKKEEWDHRSIEFTTAEKQTTILVRIFSPEVIRVKKIFVGDADLILEYVPHSMEYEGSGIKIGPDSVDISAKHFNLELLGKNGEVKNVISADANGFEKIICKNINLQGRDVYGDDSRIIWINGRSGRDHFTGENIVNGYKTITKAIKEISLNHSEIIINISGKNLYEEIEFDFGGNGSIHLYGDGATLYGNIKITNGSHMIHLHNFNIVSSKDFAVKSTSPGSMVFLENCVLDCNNIPNSTGAYFAYGSRGVLNNCEINNCTYAIYFAYLSMGGTYNCYGKNNNYSLYTTNSGYILAEGFIPHAPYIITEKYGGLVYGDVAAYNYAPRYRTPKITKTVDFKGIKYATLANDKWIPGILKQGVEWDENGNKIVYKGFAVFDKADIAYKVPKCFIQNLKFILKRKIDDDPTGKKIICMNTHANSELSGEGKIIRAIGEMSELKSEEEIFFNYGEGPINDISEKHGYGFCFYTEKESKDYLLEFDTEFGVTIRAEYFERE